MRVIDMRRVRLSVVAVLAIVSWGPRIDAQDAPSPAVAPSGAKFTGRVVADGTGAPLAYSTITVDPVGGERFTDQNGSFIYYAVPAGTYRVRVRQLGYIPLDTTVRITVPVTNSLVFVMNRIPTALEQVQVSAPPRRCIVPDTDGYVDDSELATVLGEARKNAERERLLRRTYPFEYRMAQSHSTYNLVTKGQTTRYDTMTFRSDDHWKYRKGKVVSDDRNRVFGDVRVMRLPTLADLADRGFLTAHCFKYSGITDLIGAPAHRVDFSPDSSVVAPDVEGSIFIDSATYLIKRAEFRLTRGGTVSPPILGMNVTTTYREILPNVALFDVIASVQPLGSETPGANATEFREMQRLVSFRFLRGGPPGTDGHQWIPATGTVSAPATKPGTAPTALQSSPPP